MRHRSSHARRPASGADGEHVSRIRLSCWTRERCPLHFASETQRWWQLRWLVVQCAVILARPIATPYEDQLPELRDNTAMHNVMYLLGADAMDMGKGEGVRALRGARSLFGGTDNVAVQENATFAANSPGDHAVPDVCMRMCT